MTGSRLNAVFTLGLNEEAAQRLKEYLENSPNVHKDYYDRNTGERAYSIETGGKVFWKENSNNVRAPGLTIDSMEQIIAALKGK